MRTTLLQPGLASSATLLFNHPIWCIMLIINRLLINSNNDDEHYEVLVTRQTRNDNNYDTSRKYDSFSIRSTVAVQWEDGGQWTHGTVVGRGNHSHSSRSYMIRISKTGWVVTRNSKHIKPTLIATRQYLRDQITKNTSDPVNKNFKEL